MLRRVARGIPGRLSRTAPCGRISCPGSWPVWETCRTCATPLFQTKSKPHLPDSVDGAQQLLMAVPLTHDCASADGSPYFLNHLRTWYSTTAQTQRTKMMLNTNPKLLSFLSRCYRLPGAWREAAIRRNALRQTPAQVVP